jgi:hypothetical protein
MLSSVRIPWEDIGYRAAQTLDRLLSGKRALGDPRWVAPRGVALRASTDVVACEDDCVRRAVNFIRLNVGLRMRVGDVARHTGISRRNIERRMLSGEDVHPPVGHHRTAVAGVVDVGRPLAPPHLPRLGRVVVQGGVADRLGVRRRPADPASRLRVRRRPSRQRPAG